MHKAYPNPPSIPRRSILLARIDHPVRGAVYTEGYPRGRVGIVGRPQRIVGQVAQVCRRRWRIARAWIHPLSAPFARVGPVLVGQVDANIKTTTQAACGRCQHDAAQATVQRQHALGCVNVGLAGIHPTRVPSKTNAAQRNRRVVVVRVYHPSHTIPVFCCDPNGQIAQVASCRIGQHQFAKAGGGGAKAVPIGADHRIRVQIQSAAGQGNSVRVYRDNAPRNVIRPVRGLRGPTH